MIGQDGKFHYLAGFLFCWLSLGLFIWPRLGDLFESKYPQNFVCLILQIWFGLVRFYGISTIVGYLMLNPFSYIQAILFQTIQFSISTHFSSIWSIDRTLSGATTPGQSGPGSNKNEGVLHIPQSSSITRASPSDCLVSYPGHSLGESYPSAEMQTVYSTAPANWAMIF